MVDRMYLENGKTFKISDDENSAEFFDPAGNSNLPSKLKAVCQKLCDGCFFYFPGGCNHPIPEKTFCCDSRKDGKSIIWECEDNSPILQQHELYKDSDADKPDSILDSNGQVALAMCKKCGKLEIDLDGKCLAEEAKPECNLLPTESVINSAEFSKKTAADILELMAGTYRERNAVYGDNYQMVGPIMKIMFPDGVPTDLLGSHQFHLFELIVVKLTRFAVSKLQHQDSIHDAGVYAAMIESILNSEG